MKSIMHTFLTITLLCFSCILSAQFDAAKRNSSASELLFWQTSSDNTIHTISRTAGGDWSDDLTIIPAGPQAIGYPLCILNDNNVALMVWASYDESNSYLEMAQLTIGGSEWGSYSLIAEYSIFTDFISSFDVSFDDDGNYTVAWITEFNETLGYTTSDPISTN